MLLLTSLPCMVFQRSHFSKPGRQYSSTYASVYSWPCPLPKRPCVRIAVMTCTCSKSICKYSLRPRETICFGHQAPPLLSTFSLQAKKKAMINFKTKVNESKMKIRYAHLKTKKKNKNDLYAYPAYAFDWLKSRFKAYASLIKNTLCYSEAAVAHTCNYVIYALL